jgi:Tfp pilus assembly pilus retraction ATPase PilT
MTQIIITKDIVRRMSAAMSTTDATTLNHTARIALIAEAFGWRPDAFMHALKGQHDRAAAAPSLSADDVSLPELGIGQPEKWKGILAKTSGVCVACGCTQSGRTTTLVASPNHLREAGRHIFHRGRVTQEHSRVGDVLLFGPIRCRS